MFGQAQNSGTPVYRISPADCSGWQAAKNAEKIDLLSSANRGDFSAENSAYISNVNIIVNGANSDDKQQLDDIKSTLVCSGFSLPDDLPKDGRLESASLKISLAANGFAESEDVVVLEYSLDGENWQNIDSFATTGQSSNGTHGGYWQVDLANFNLDQISKFQVRADFLAMPSDEVSSVFVDGMGLDISVKERPVLKNLKLPENSVRVEKNLYKATETPEIAVQVAEKSRLNFLGFDGVKREVEEVKVTDPSGAKFPVEFETSQSTSSRSTFEDYKLKNSNFKKPGKYKITFKIIQDNVEGEITRDFSWGVLVMNTDKSIYHPGETVKIGMGTLDSKGHTLCDTDLRLTVTSPWGEKKDFSTQDKTISLSPECGPTTVTNVPDYSAAYDTGVEGEYVFKLKAVTAEGVNEIEEKIPVKAVIAFDISRSGPTRVWPIAPYEMKLEITANENYQGSFSDFVPDDFAIISIDNNGQSASATGDRKSIDWQVDWQVGKTYTLSYIFNPPDISPAIFYLGKIKVGTFEEYRQWQIASDAVSGSNLATSGTAVNGQSYATASITPSSNALVLAWVVNSHASAANTVTLSGNSLTWEEVTNTTFSGGLYRLTLFRAMGASPTTGAVTVTVAGTANTGARWSITQYTGTDTSGTNGSGAVVQSQTNTATAAADLTVTLSAFGSTNNVTAAGFSIDNRAFIDNEAGWTEFGDSGNSAPGTELESEWIASNDTSAYASIASGTQNWGGIAVEIKAAVSTVTVSGTAYTNETGTTLNSSGGTIILVNGATGATFSDADGTDGSGVWSITGVTAPSNGDVLTIWIDGATADGTLALKYGASCTGTPNCTGLSIYQNRVIIRNEHTGSIANSDLANCDNDSGTNCANTEIGFTSNTNALTVSSGLELHIWTGDTYDPGGTVTTNATGGDLHVDDSATAYLDTATSAIGLDVLVDGGANLTIDADTTIAGGDITTSGTSAVVTTASGTPTVTISGTGSIGGGTTPSLTFYNLTLTGTPTLASDISIKNNLTLPASVTAGSTTVTMTGTNGTIVGGGATLNNLTIDPATTGATTLDTSDLTVSGTVNVATDDTFNIGSGRTLVHTGSTLTLNGTLSGPGRYTYRSSTAFPTSGSLSGSLILRFDTTSTNQTMSNRTDYQLVEIDNSGATNGRTVTMSASTHTLAGSLTVLSSGTGSVTLVGADNNPTVNVGGALTYTAGGGTKTITTGTGTWTVSGNVNLTNGTFTATANNTLTMNGSGTALTTASNQPFNFVANPGSGNTITLSDTFTTQLFGDVTISSGTLASAYNMTVNGGDLTGAGALNHTANTVTLYTSGVIGSSSTADWTLNNLTLSIGATGCTLAYNTTTGAGSGTMTINGTLTTQSCNCGESCGYQHTLDAGAKTWILTGATPASVSAITYLIGNTSTFRYTGVNPSSNVSVGFTGPSTTYYYYNLELQPSSAETYTLPGTTINVKNNFLVSADTTISADVWSEVAMIGPGTVDANGETLYNLKIDPVTSGTVTVQNTDVIVSNVFTVAVDDTLSISSARMVSHTGSYFLHNGTISGLGTLRFTDTSCGPGSGGTISSVVRYDATGGNILNTIFDARTYGGDVEVYVNTGNIRSIAMAAGTQQINGNFKIITDASQSQVLTMDASANPTVNITGDLTFTKGGSATPAIITGSGTWKVSGSVNFTNGTFTASTNNTLEMDGTAKTITSASQGLQKFKVSGGSVASADAMLVNQTFDVTAGGFTQAASANLSVYGNFTLAAGTTFTASTSGILILDGNPSPNTFTDSTSPKQNMGDVQIGLSPGTTDLASDTSVRSLTVNAGDTYNTNGYDVTSDGAITIDGIMDVNDDVETDGTYIICRGKFDLQATGTYANSSGTNVGSTLNMGIGAVVADVVNDLITAGTGSLYDLVVNDGGGAYTLTVNVQDPLVVLNNVTITGGVLDTVNMENNAISIGGNWTNSDLFTARSGTVTFNATGSGHTINPGGSSFYNLTFNGANGEWSPLTNTVTVTNDLIMTAGTFTTAAGTANVTVNGNVQCLTTCGTINMASTNTFTQSVAAAKSFGTNVAVATNWTFYNLTFTNTSGTNTITTNGTGTGQIIVANDLALTNTGTALTLDNNTNDRILDVNGSVSIGSGTTLSASSSASFTVAKSWTNNGVFTHNSGTVTLDSANAGTITGSTTFYNLYSSGIGAAKTITFVHGTTQTVEGTWTAVGSAGNLITLQRDNTGAWIITPTAATVSYVDVSWSTNSGNSFCATYSMDSLNNTGWNISTGAFCNKTLSVLLSGNTAALGTLSVSSVNQADITSTVTTNATSGYISMVKYDHTLTSGTDTIADTAGGTIVAGTAEYGASSSQSGNTIAQWNPAACSNTASTSNATALTTAFQSFASNAGAATSEVTTLCFEASITAASAAGSYHSNATVVTTARF